MLDSQPIIISQAQRTWRDRNPDRSLLDALEEVSVAALQDIGSARLTAAVDTVATVPFLASQVPDLAGMMPMHSGDILCQRLGLRATTFTSDVGGNTPQLMVNYFADRLAAGESRAVLVTGAELFATLFSALSSGQDLSHWQQSGVRPPIKLDEPRPPCTELERAHGMFEPINTYPLFESALRHAAGWDQQTHLARLGRLVSGMSEVAAANPYAWRQEALSPAQVLDPNQGNRMITWPYTKVMNAILAVDMAAAVVMTTVGTARELGIDPSRWVYLRGGAEANDIWNVSERERLHESPALAACSRSALAMAGLELAEVDLFDLYSCFPSAVQVACNAIGLDVEDPRGVTVTGGLTLFGGPGNNYSLHAIAEMVSRLQAGKGRHGLVTANGNYLTKHAVGVYSVDPGSAPWPLARPDLQVLLDAGPRLVVDAKARGTGTLDACAVVFGKEGPRRGIVLGRMQDGRRFIANTPADPALLARLVAMDPVGVQGRVTPG
ncbi:MAG TPA: acetyl-CoA acetyltransferase, partial [Kineobactrum sp.]